MKIFNIFEKKEKTYSLTEVTELLRKKEYERYTTIPKQDGRYLLVLDTEYDKIVRENNLVEKKEYHTNTLRDKYGYNNVNYGQGYWNNNSNNYTKTDKLDMYR